MGIGIGATTSSRTTTTGTTTDPNAAPASEEPAPVEDTYDTAEPNAWGTFVEGTPGAAAPIAMNDTAGPAMDFSADTIAEVAATAGASLGTLSDPAGDPVAALGGVVDSANMTATTDEVDALIASEQGTLDAVYGALETAPTEVKSELISGLTQLSELAGPTGQTALADGVVGAMELDRDMSETNQDIIGAMGESVYEGEGATLMANVTTGLLRAEGDYAGYYG